MTAVDTGARPSATRAGAAMRFAVVPALWLLWLGTLAPAAADRAAPAAEHRQDTSIAGHRYVTFVTGNAKPEERLPMIVGLHYSGARPETIVRDFDGIDFPARIVLPRGKYPRRADYSWFPSGYTGLEASAQRKMTFQIVDEVAAFLDAARMEFPTRGKPIVVGTSYGGDLSFLLALYHPEQVLAAFPVAARFPPAWMPGANTCGAACPPIHVMHGTQDRTVPMEPTRQAARRLAGMGFRVEFREYAGVGHDFSTGMKEDFVAAVRKIVARE